MEQLNDNAAHRGRPSKYQFQTFAIGEERTISGEPKKIIVAAHSYGNQNKVSFRCAKIDNENARVTRIS